MPIYAWGSNGSGQLGIGHEDDVSVPTRCRALKQYDEEEPESITAGGNHTLILFKSGRLISVGRASPSVGELENLNVRHCSANWNTSTVCLDSINLVTTGAGDFGELGRGEAIKQDPEDHTFLDLASLLGDTQIVHLSGGLQHTVAILSNGDVLGWGNGRKGQLGTPNEIVWSLRKIQGIDFKVVKAVCGQFFTLLAGDPQSGRFEVLTRQDKFGIKSSAPPDITGWKDIGASWGSIFVLLESGGLLRWGRNDHGQLGPEALSNIDKIAIGSEHALALSKAGKLYAWGWGEHGNCGSDTDGNGDVKFQEIEIPAEVGGIRGIGAGCATSWFWT